MPSLPVCSHTACSSRLLGWSCSRLYHLPLFRSMVPPKSLQHPFTQAWPAPLYSSYPRPPLPSAWSGAPRNQIYLWPATWAPMCTTVRAGLELSLTTLSHSASLVPAVTCSVTRDACSYLGWPVERFPGVGLGPSGAGIFCFSSHLCLLGQLSSQWSTLLSCWHLVWETSVGRS